MPQILIAEDDRRVRESLERALTIEGYDVRAANDGAAVLELHATAPADLLLLDVSMPNVDGLCGGLASIQFFDIAILEVNLKLSLDHVAH